jgi:hypothetical protein
MYTARVGERTDLHLDDGEMFDPVLLKLIFFLGCF